MCRYIYIHTDLFMEYNFAFLYASRFVISMLLYLFQLINQLFFHELYLSDSFQHSILQLMFLSYTIP